MVDLDEAQWALRRGSLVYPSPVAIACGRVLRARTASERVNACLKAGEVLARYLAGSGGGVVRDKRRGWGGEAKRATWQPRVRPLLDHGSGSRRQQRRNIPAAPLLAQGFKKTKRNQEVLRGQTDAALVRCSSCETTSDTSSEPR